MNRHAEVAFPILYQSDNDAYGASEFDLDCHYRYFLGNNQKGFYASGFIRYSHLHGYKDNEYIDNNGIYSTTFTEQSFNRIGLGVGLGVRIFSRKGLYWGAGMVLGRYLDSGFQLHNNFNLTLSDAGVPIIIELELFKIGWAF